ncbi:methionine/alanine import family NSS transporter small subunit [Oceanobacillus sp. Castelsardo]|nr:methionine/alanine import family NSS transporter small subunit [Oceanobacillus sp. Castelsardo]
MTGGAIVVMIIGIVIIWGGLGLSIAHAMKNSKKVG